MSPLAGVRNFLSNHTQISTARPETMPPAYPPIPASLDAGDHELRDYYVSNKQDVAHAHTAPQYTPYLGLRARLSQTWINKWTILLLLVLCRVLLAVKNLDSNIANAKSEALSACTNVEKVGSAMASMPHYLSAGVNSLAADGIVSAVNGLEKVLMMTLTGVEEIVLFVINMMTSTYVCLITLVVTGSISAALDMIEQVGDFMNKTIGDLTSEISKDVSGFTNTLNSFISGIGSLTSILGGSKTVPQIDISGPLKKLTSIQIDPTSMDADLEKIRANLPDFKEVQNFTNSVIRFPFEEVKKLVNESLGTYSFDKSVFPLAQKQALIFCSDNNAISEFFDGLADLAVLAKKIFIAVICILAVAACVPMAYREIWRYRTMVQRSQLLQKNAFDPMDVMYIASRPYTSTAGIKIAGKFKSTKRQVLVRWAIAYATSVPALFVLALGIAGLFSALCQYILLKSIEKEVPALAAEVGNFTGTVVNALNNASTSWAVSANHVINNTQNDINKDVFGWVNTTTTAVNETLNVFVDETTKVLNATFGGTILYKPIMETLNCLVGLKIASLQTGLTWVHDHAHVSLPEFNKDVFSLGAAASLTDSTADDSFLSSPGSSTSDDVTGAITKLVRIMAAGIKEEALVATGLVGIWLLIVLIGVITALTGFVSKDRTRGEGGGPGTAGMYTGERRAPLSPRNSPPGMTKSTFPDFGPHTAGTGSAHSEPWASGGYNEPVREKFGAVADERSVGVSRGHQRQSSYGQVNEKR